MNLIVRSVGLIALAVLAGCSGGDTTPAGRLTPEDSVSTSPVPTPTDPQSIAEKELTAATEKFNKVVLQGSNSNDTSFDYRSVATGVALKGLTRTLALNAAQGFRISATGSISNILVTAIILEKNPPTAQTTACTHQVVTTRRTNGTIVGSGDSYSLSTLNFERTTLGWRVSRASSIEDSKGVCPRTATGLEEK
jgi:hypothetical protein